MTRHKIKAYAARAGRYGTQHHLVIATLVFAALGSWFSYQSLRHQQQATAEADFDIELENTVENLSRFEKVDEHTSVVFAPPAWCKAQPRRQHDSAGGMGWNGFACLTRTKRAIGS